MFNEKVAWLEGVNITYQHMQLSEDLMLNKVFSLFKRAFHLSKAVVDIDYKIDKGSLSITKALVIGKDNSLSVVDKNISVSFLDVEPGVYDININTEDANGLNGAPGYKNDSCGALVSVKEKVDKYDSSRAKDILMVKPKLNCYLTLVLDGADHFEEDSSVPMLRVGWNSNELSIKEELYSYNVSSKSFLNALEKLSCDAATSIEKLVRNKVYNNYSEIYKDLFFSHHMIKACEGAGYNAKHGQKIIIELLKNIEAAESTSKRIEKYNKIFEEDVDGVWFCKEKIDRGYIKCELKTSISDIKEIESLILVQDYENIMSCYQSGHPGMQIELENFKRVNERVFLCMRVNWSDLNTVALKALFDMEILKVWIDS